MRVDGQGQHPSVGCHLADLRDDVNYPYLSRISPFLENIRSEPRFEEILERVERAWRSFGTSQ